MTVVLEGPVIVLINLHSVLNLRGLPKPEFLVKNDESDFIAGWRLLQEF